MSSQSNDHTEGQINPTGVLKIKVPHWLVQVRIYDNAYKLIRYINEFEKVNDSAGLFEAETSLTPGIYEIEVSLADKVERKLISVRSKKTSLFELSGNEWKSIQMSSSIPPDNTVSTVINKTGIVKEWNSKGPIESLGNDKDANVFLYVQMPKELDETNSFSEFFDFKKIPGVDETYPRMNEASSVINAEKDLVISSARKVICFSAALPSGFYMLEFLINDLIGDEHNNDERNEKKLIKIYQPVFLHSGWCTQLFISTHKPASEAFSMNMVRPGDVSHKNDEAVMAAKAVLATLSLDVRRSIVNKEEMKKLLSEENANPWLGILAAYALNSTISIPFEKTKLIGEDAKNLLDEILLFLKKEIPDHPDVHALHLELNRPAEKPFYYPPMIYKGLRRIKMHAEKYESTVPCYSLTDYVLRTTLINGPLVTWEKLSVPDDLNASDPGTEKSAEIFSDTPANTEPDASNKPIVELTGAVSSKAPIFRLSAESDPSLKADTSSQLSQANSSISTLQEASLINIVQKIAEKNNYNELPEKYAINYADSLYNTLSSIKAGEISMATSLPLSRVSAGIDSIFKKRNQISGSNSEENSQIQLSYDEQMIIKYALQVAGGKKNPDLVAEMLRSGEQVKVADSNVGLNPADHQVDVVNDDLTIEQCVARLKSEQDRILLGSREKDNEYNKSSQLFALRLQNVAIELLKRAAFMAVTNSRGKIIYGNGAFVNLLSLGNNVQDEIASIGGTTFYQFKANNRKRNLPQWETALQELPLGRSTINAPVENRYFKVWEVKRSQLEEQVEGALNNYLNILRGVEAPSILVKTKQEIGDILCDLESYTPLYAHHSGKSLNPYAEEINSIIHGLERLVSQGS